MNKNTKLEVVEAGKIVLALGMTVGATFVFLILACVASKVSQTCMSVVFYGGLPVLALSFLKGVNIFNKVYGYAK